LHLEPDARRWTAPETRAVAGLIVLCVIAQFADQWVFLHVAYPGIYDRGWARMLRVLGYGPTWALAALGLALHDRASRRRTRRLRPARRATSLLVAVCVAGLGAEALKLLIRRERPGLTAGRHVFRAWSDQPFSSAQLGLPSSEAAVAFAGAAVLAQLFPEASLLWYGLALGCGLTRVAAGAHFLSDAVLAALVGYVVARWVSRWSGDVDDECA
jgi:membrane-associated phospholipid phosphatase